MADDLTKRGSQDRARINMSEDYEVAYWTKNGVSTATANGCREAGRPDVGRCGEAPGQGTIVVAAKSYL
jgi:hypothetical protein